MKAATKTGNTKAMECDIRDALRIYAQRADPTGDDKGGEGDIMRQAAKWIDDLAAMNEVRLARIEKLERALRHLHADCTDLYKAARLPAESFVAATNALASGQEGA